MIDFQNGDIFKLRNTGRFQNEKLIAPLFVSGEEFLGEYQAGGIIIVLGLETGGKKTVGTFPCTGMHGGKVYLRGDCEGIRLPAQVSSRKATEADMSEIETYLDEYCGIFGLDRNMIKSQQYTVITPDSSNPYKQLYVAN